MNSFLRRSRETTESQTWLRLITSTLVPTGYLIVVETTVLDNHLPVSVWAYTIGLLVTGLMVAACIISLIWRWRARSQRQPDKTTRLQYALNLVYAVPLILWAVVLPEVKPWARVLLMLGAILLVADAIAGATRRRRLT